MTMMLTETVQRRLADLGWYGGAVDGVAGPMTSQALTEFKAAHGFAARDYAGPLTLATLFGDGAKTRPAAAALAAGVPVAAAAVPPWYVEARGRIGLDERGDNAALRAWLKSDGATLGDPASLPWCGDFVATCIALALPDERLPAEPYLARNWLAFGRACGPVLGAVAVFWRGSPTGTSGHVAFIAGEDATTYHVLGGNQSDSVSITRIVKGRLLGCRWPVSYPLGTATVQREAAGAVSTNEA